MPTASGHLFMKNPFFDRGRNFSEIILISSFQSAEEEVRLIACAVSVLCFKMMLGRTKQKRITLLLNALHVSSRHGES